MKTMRESDTVALALKQSCSSALPLDTERTLLVRLSWGRKRRQAVVVVPALEELTFTKTTITLTPSLSMQLRL